MKKEMFEAKEKYIEKRNRKNEENTNLSAEQHSAIQHLCSMRHKLHTYGVDALYCSESQGYEELNDYFNEEMYTELEDTDLPDIDSSIGSTIMYLPCDNDWYELDDEEQETYDDGYNKWMLEQKNIIANAISKINSTIEKYLKAIDDEYGTNYAPTGYTRIY